MKEPLWRRYLRFWGSNIPDDVNDEIRFHVEMRIADYVRSGMSPEQARAAAQERFGNEDSARSQCIHIRETHEKSMARAQWFDALRQDIHFAWRVLLRQPMPTVASVFCLVVGIGASTAMFSVADTMLRKPLAFPNGERLVSIHGVLRGRDRGGVMSLQDIEDIRARQRTFSDIGAGTYKDFTWLTTESRRVSAAAVTASIFNTLGARAEAGRLFRDEDEKTGNENVVVVSRGFADRWLGGPVAAIDKTMNLSGQTYRVVGVLPDAWRFPERAELFVPLAGDLRKKERGDRYLRVLGAMKEGVPLPTAAGDLERIATELRTEYAQNLRDDMHVSIAPVRDQYIHSAQSSLFALSAASLLVLLIACANVAGLQLARATARHREIALRTAIGARRSRVLRQLLTESVLLALVSGVGGCAFAWWAAKLIGRAIATTAPTWMTFALDPSALAFAVFVSAASGLAFGVLPALRLGRLDPALALRGGRSTDPARGRLQRVFVVAEIALSALLLVGTGLAIQSVRALGNTPLGFEPQSVMTFRLNLQGARYDSAANRAATIAMLAERIEQLPGVVSAGAVTRLPVSGCCSQFGTAIEGREGKDVGLLVNGNFVTPDYFKTMKISVVKGRGILPTDKAGNTPVVVINETFAKMFWPNGDAIGKRVSIGAQGWSEIVGIVNDIKQNTIIEQGEPQFYRPHREDPWVAMAFVVRTSNADAATIMPQVRRVLREIDVTQPAFGESLMTTLVDRELTTERMLGRLLGAFAAVALLLAASGVYAAMSFFVSQRIHELGVRMALGADTRTVLQLVLSRAAIMTVVGLMVGLAGSFVAAKTIAHQMYGVNPRDPIVYVAAALTLIVSTTIATLAPSRRATSVDPMTVLRGE